VNGVRRLAKEIKKRTNPTMYSPMFGKVIRLPELQIQLRSKIVLDKDDVVSTFDLYETRVYDGNVEYIHLNKTVALLPYSADNKFIAIGVLIE
jgi:hypothetical protein